MRPNTPSSPTVGTPPCSSASSNQKMSVGSYSPSSMVISPLWTIPTPLTVSSSADAHSNHFDWIPRLSDALRSLHRFNKKLLGICFGHQILARALGGKTGRASVGWEIGIKQLQIDSKMMSQIYGLEMSPTLNVIESHRDQVLSVPPSAIVLASSEKTEIEMFAVGDCVLGIQCHPEFSKDVMLDIIHCRLSGDAFSAEVANEAIGSLEKHQPDQQPLQLLCKRFLKGNFEVV
ncbi:hypothetical protein QJS10_CPA02g01626 [Acorus calamus]|uniref:Glutamine amidotransferase domain-containing protein n=1 Tax=Acorus calamus TaxID=4465 RepID=A0AAV9FDV0_ACOCL|nr:hypothetical protein QJS10_CPA02g01626 [Acorus calamus]